MKFVFENEKDYFATREELKAKYPNVIKRTEDGFKQIKQENEERKQRQYDRD